MKTRKRQNNQRRTPALRAEGTSALQPTASPNYAAELVPPPVMMPALNAAHTLGHWTEPGDSDLDKLVVGFALQGRALRQGDLSDAERMLMAQASTLDVIFNQLARRAALNAGQTLATCDAFLRLALKAQGQCRATLETLSLVKNPRSVSFVRQANIANGPQQVNNGRQRQPRAP